jgi:hypothetical protein
VPGNTGHESEEATIMTPFVSAAVMMAAAYTAISSRRFHNGVHQAISAEVTASSIAD